MAFYSYASCGLSWIASQSLSFSVLLIGALHSKAGGDQTKANKNKQTKKTWTAYFSFSLL
jgi:hypothetical protein